MEAVVGIDPSLTGTAVCVMRRDGSCDMSLLTSKAASGLVERLERYRGLAHQVRDKLDGADVQSLCLEGYSFGSKGQGVLDLAEFGGILRDELVKHQGCAHNPAPEEVPPSSLKKFATGTGNADKLKVCLAIQKRYGVTFETNDEFDAYALARIAGCKAGWWEPETAAQREALSVKVKTKKPKSA